MVHDVVPIPQRRSYVLALLSTDNNGFLENYKGLTVPHCLAKELTPVAITKLTSVTEGWLRPCITEPTSRLVEIGVLTSHCGHLQLGSTGVL